MNDMFTFERASWELLLDGMKAGSSLSAVRFLTALEQEDESTVEEAFEALSEKKITLDISGLPADYSAADQEKRLRLEEELVRSGRLVENLEGTDPLRLYLEELAAVPAQGDPAVLVQQLAQGDETAAQKLANLYLCLAVEEAKACTGRGVLLMDLIQEASLGLWQGILSYTDGDLQEHLMWYIRHSLARVVALQARQKGVVQNMRTAMEAFQAADRQLLTALGRNATLEEIALEMGVSPEQAQIVQDMIRSAQAMEKTKAEPEPEEEAQQAVEDTAYFQSRQRVEEMLSDLTQTQAQVLKLRFGLDGGVPESPEAVGRKLGMTADAVVEMEAAALAKLRQQ